LPKLHPLLKAMEPFISHLKECNHPRIEPVHPLPSALWLARFRAGYISQFPNVPRINSTPRVQAMGLPVVLAPFGWLGFVNIA